VTAEQWILLIVPLLLGSGGIAAWYKAHSDRKLGIEGNETKAQESVMGAWSSITTALQTQLNSQETKLSNQGSQLEDQNKKINELWSKINHMGRMSLFKDRIIYAMEHHIVVLEAGHPDPKPLRPIEMEWIKNGIPDDETEDEG